MGVVFKQKSGATPGCTTSCAIDDSTFLQLKRAGVWPPGALSKKSKHTDLCIVHLQSDTKNHTDLFSQFLKK